MATDTERDTGRVATGIDLTGVHSAPGGDPASSSTERIRVECDERRIDVVTFAFRSHATNLMMLVPGESGHEIMPKVADGGGGGGQ